MDDRLKLHIEAIETLNAQKQVTADYVKDQFALAKSEGYDPKAMRHVIKLRKMQKDEREQFEGIVDTYSVALGDV